MSTDRGRSVNSLETFDPTNRREPILNSPRSVEACRRQGIDPHELIIRSQQEIKEFFKHKRMDPEALDLVCKHYEERRQEKVRVLLEERAQLVEDERNGLIEFDPETLKGKEIKGGSGSGSGSQPKHGNYLGSAVSGGGESTLIEREKRQLDKIRKRQEKEIKQIMDHETRLAEIRKVQEEKLEAQKEKERQREMELLQKRKEAEELKKEKGYEKQMQEQEEVERQKRLAQDAYQREQEKMVQEKERERLRQIELREKEEFQKQKQAEFVRKTEEKLMDQQMRVEQRKQEMDVKDQMRQEMMRRQQEEKQKDSEAKRRALEEKFAYTKERNDELLKQKKIEYDEKLQKNEEKRRMFEYEREEKNQEAKMRAEMHAVLIKKVIDENANQGEAKRSESLMKRAVADERKIQLDRQAERQRQIRVLEEREKEEKRKGVKENMEIILKDKTDNYVHKFKESEIKVAIVQKMKHDEHKTKSHIGTLKKLDKEENVHRIAKMQEYQREKIMEKILSDNEKAERIKKERDGLLETRQNMRKDIDRNKRELLENFEKMKRSKMGSQYEAGSGSESGSREFSKNRMLSTMKPKSISQNTGSRQQLHPKTAESNKRLRPLEGIELPNKQKNFEQSKESGKPQLSEKEAKKMIENLKISQNHEMLLLLEEEQNNESEREAQLRTITDGQERKRLEKIFGMERAKAHARIQALADNHEEAVRDLVIKYNIKSIY